MNGCLLVDKPKGTTSFDLVDHLRDLTGVSKVGHGGTLDKEATGLLIVLVGKGTKLFQYVQIEAAEYRFEVEFGRRTDTLDVDGDVVETREWSHLDRDGLEGMLPRFTGTIDQVPPTYSAVKVDGKRASERARAGEDVELEPREIEIEALELVDLDLPHATFEVRCHSGTYVRAIARDLGEALETCAYATGIRRTEKSGFRIEDAIDPSALDEENVASHLVSPLELVGSLPRYDADADETKAVGYGQRPPLEPTWLDEHGLDVGDPFAVADPEGELAAVAVVRDDRGEPVLQPRTVLKTSG